MEEAVGATGKRKNLDTLSSSSIRRLWCPLRRPTEAQQGEGGVLILDPAQMRSLELRVSSCSPEQGGVDGNFAATEPESSNRRDEVKRLEKVQDINAALLLQSAVANTHVDQLQRNCRDLEADAADAREELRIKTLELERAKNRAHTCELELFGQRHEVQRLRNLVDRNSDAERQEIIKVVSAAAETVGLKLQFLEPCS
mmetsp:Transcript_2366/g.6836  ORF Transcript_2366/g.6836 Transcript_2366/m.6836 type:complete len:199 (-) Transcript_2366:119-715(-)